MSASNVLSGPCMVTGCGGRRETWLGVCAEHWRILDSGLRREWWCSWHDDGRVEVWLNTRRACLAWLAHHGT